jgi:hypothetical protein
VDEIKDFSKMSLLSSLGALFLSSLLLSSVLAPTIGEKLITSDLTSNSRYGVTFPALEYIEGLDESSVVGIGSSIIQAALDGSCITEKLDRKGTSVYNLGISGGNPYTESLQIPALVRANPELVILDLGPNGLWDFYDSDDLNDYIQFRFTINSISMGHEDIGEWHNFIREKDQQWLAYTHLDRVKIMQSYSQKTVDEYLKEHISNQLGLDYETRAPAPGDEDWHQYLMEPYFPNPFFETMSDESILEYMDEKMPRKAKQGVYNPRPYGTLNHQAYEYMIDTLRNAGIPVLLVATPHHPLVYPYLGPNQLDGFNHTFNTFSNLSGVYGLNMFWETWHSSMFKDRNHIGVNGREYFCGQITPYIEQLLETGRLEENVIQFDGVDLSGYLESSCNGTGRTHQLKAQIEFIQAESYSDCSHGEGIGFQDNWKTVQGQDHRGSGYVHALPEDVSQYKENILGSRLDYNLTFDESGEYFVWVKMKGDSYGNDSIGMSWKEGNQEYADLEKYSSFGWSSYGQWEWEPEFNRPPMSINATESKDYTLSIWMREDGVMLDEIMITNIESLNPKTTNPYTISNRNILCEGSDQVFQIVAETLIEAEDFTRCEYGEGESIEHEWVQVLSDNSSGGAFMHALPDNKVHMRYSLSGPQLIYELFLPSEGSYYVWISTRGSSYGNDTIELSWSFLDETDELVISSHAWDSVGQWEWEPKSTREPLNLTVNQSGVVKLIISMREDGVELDSILVTPNKDFDPIKEM